ncbi:hypothetical protein [Dechloromonas sp. ZS-1]|uniref:hypothetical protein n=1 Tax=Dechloromonas sp. ZS-1 TaxID=3138067 RepID=UPI0031FE1A1A
MKNNNAYPCGAPSLILAHAALSVYEKTAAPIRLSLNSLNRTAVGWLDIEIEKWVLKCQDLGAENEKEAN